MGLSPERAITLAERPVDSLRPSWRTVKSPGR